uniref:Uncharacterized protein n=1 Tax=Tetranychus urticae TaxID=32264 RepID=T1KW73_TETUR
MDNSQKNIEKDDISDKDEGYHDIVIDWSDESFPYKDQQVINQVSHFLMFHFDFADFEIKLDIQFYSEQLSSIIGIPVQLIRMTILIYAPNNWFDLRNIEHKSSDPWIYGPGEDEPNAMSCFFTRKNCLGRLNDGDRFVLRTDLWPDGCCFDLCIYLYSLDSEFYNENNCTESYCHYSNKKTFIDRRISVATNTELHMILRVKYAELPPIVDANSYEENYSQRRRILRELDTEMYFLMQQCCSRHHHRYISSYSRTRASFQNEIPNFGKIMAQQPLEALKPFVFLEFMIDVLAGVMLGKAALSPPLKSF